MENQEQSGQLQEMRLALKERRWSDVTMLSKEARATLRGDFWPLLATVHGNGIDLVNALVEWPPEGFSDASENLLPVLDQLPALSHSQGEAILELANRVERRFLYRIRHHLQRHIAKRPVLGSELGATVLAKFEVASPATEIWMTAFCMEAGREAATYVVSLMGDEAKGRQLLARLAGYLATKQAAIQEVLKPVEDQLLAVLLSSAGHDEAAWAAIANMSEFSPNSADALISAVRQEVLPAARALSALLGTSSAEGVAVGDLSVVSAVNMLLELAFKHRELLPLVDQGISHLLYRPGYAAVLPCIEALGLASIDLDVDFPETLAAIADNPEAFSILLTKWLLLEGVQFTLIGKLLSQCTSGRAVPGLDVATFKQAPSARKVVAARRLLSLLHNGDVLCEFIRVLAESAELQPAGLEIAAQMLNEAYVEYPSATYDFLKARTSDGGRQQPHERVFRDVYANVLRWRRVLQRLPKLNELRTTSSETQVFRALRQRENRDIVNAARRQSIFAQFARKVHIAQGSRYTTLSDQSYGEVNSMGEVSHSIELPSSEVADPVGGLIRRMTRLAGSR